jgi:Domain of unknown function (DUF1707)
MTGDDRLPELRASHEDRDRVAEQLRIAAGDGRLTLEELDERLEHALTARTGGELAVLVADLPAVAGPVAAEVKDLVVIDCDKTVLSRVGPWVVPRAMEIRVVSGVVTLDLTEAVVTQPTLRIDADVRSGTLTIVTRPGVTLDFDDVSVHGGVVKAPPPRAPGAPTLLRIAVSGTVRGGVVSAGPPKPPRRGFLGWLLRRPRPAIAPTEPF